MKKYLIILSCSIVFLSGINAPDKSVDPKNFDRTAMKSGLLSNTNRYRRSNGAENLKRDVKLEKAAQDQADYLIKKGILTHEQPSAAKKGVKERIRYHGGSVKAYAENIAEILVQRPCSVYNARGKVEVKTLKTYDDVAIAFINGWNVSKGHRTNLTSDEYTRTGFGAAYDPKERRVIAVQVFGD